ncbi:MAG: S8 family peptidase [bacterium]
MKQKQKKLIGLEVGCILVAALFCVSNLTFKQKTNAKNVEYQKVEILKTPTDATTPEQPEIVDNQIVVKYRKNKIDLENSTGQRKADALVQNKNASKIDEIKDSNTQLIQATNFDKTLAEIKKDSNVEYAEPNLKKYPSITNVNDIDFPVQFNLAKTKTSTAWDFEAPTFGTDIVVAVIDTGVYYNHEDLTGNMWDGTQATCFSDTGAVIAGGCPNHGWDFKANDNDPMAEVLMVTDPTTQAQQDVGRHGTWVSGVLAAQTNNSIGIAGMSHNNNIKIMALRFDLDTFTFVKAMNFAKNNEAKIINASFGGTEFSQAEKDAITSFPGLFITSAGNDSLNNDITPAYPASYDNNNIISVASSEDDANGNDIISDFSNYGATTIDLAAPGKDIITTYFNSNTSYAGVGGTSFSAPMVTGAVALLESKNPNLTNAQLKNIILTTGDTFQAPADIAKTLTGKRLNVGNAISVADNIAPSKPTNLSVQ